MWITGLLLGLVGGSTGSWSFLHTSPFIPPFIHCTDAILCFFVSLVRSFILYRVLSPSRPPNPSHPLTQMVPHPLRCSMRSPRDNRLGGAHMEREEPLGGHAFFDADYEYCCWVRSSPHIYPSHDLLPSWGALKRGKLMMVTCDGQTDLHDRRELYHHGAYHARDEGRAVQSDFGEEM